MKTVNYIFSITLNRAQIRGAKILDARSLWWLDFV